MTTDDASYTATPCEGLRHQRQRTQHRSANTGARQETGPAATTTSSHHWPPLDGTAARACVRRSPSVGPSRARRYRRRYATLPSPPPTRPFPPPNHYRGAVLTATGLQQLHRCDGRRGQRTLPICCFFFFFFPPPTGKTETAHARGAWPRAGKLNIISPAPSAKTCLIVPPQRTKNNFRTINTVISLRFSGFASLYHFCDVTMRAPGAKSRAPM